MQHELRLFSIVPVCYAGAMAQKRLHKFPEPECTAEGLPTDPLHPWNIDRRSREEIADARLRLVLRNLERAWRQGSVRALRDAYAKCKNAGCHEPQWVATGIASLLTDPDALGGKRGRLARSSTREAQARRHYQRWDAVREALDHRDDGHQVTWADAYDFASKVLRGTEAAGTAEAMKDSYRQVEKILRQGKAASLYWGGF